MSGMRSQTRLRRVVTLIVLAVFVAAPLVASAQVIPSAQVLGRAVQEAYDKFKDVKDGANADYIPELAKVPSELFGVAIVTARGDVYTAGDVDYAFTIQSVSKPFTAALVMQEQGSARRDRREDRRGAHRVAVQLHPRHPDPESRCRSTRWSTPGPSRRSAWSRPRTREERFGKIMDFFERLARRQAHRASRTCTSPRRPPTSATARTPTSCSSTTASTPTRWKR